MPQFFDSPSRVSTCHFQATSQPNRKAWEPILAIKIMKMQRLDENLNCFQCFAQNIDVKSFRASKTLQNVRKTSFLCYDNYTLSVEDQKRKNHVFSKNHSSASNFSTKPMDFACKSSQKGGTVSDFTCPREVGASPNPWGL